MKTSIAAFFGLLASAAFHPIHFWPAIFIGIGGLYFLNRDASTKERIRFNFLFGICFQIFTLYWIGTYVGSFAWIALVLMQATFFIVLSFTRGPIPFALSWILFEFILRSFPFGGFGWSRIGYALTESPLNYLYPRTSIVGVAFISVFSVALIVEYRLRGGVISLGLLLLLALIPVNVTEKGSINVGLVQGGQEQKLDNTFENSEAALSKHFKATEAIYKNSVDLVIWPENAIGHDPFLRASTNKGLTTASKRINAPILVNANLVDGTNGSVLIGDGAAQSYSKRYLTPFGEFIPFKSLVEKISDKASKVIDYVPGRQAYLFRTDKANFRTLICYELLSDKQARTEMNDSDFIVAQTNNATYFNTWQLDQELSISKARSAETSRQSAYVSTTGITALLGEDGKTIMSIPKYTNDVLIGQVKLRQGVTPASKYGNLIEFSLLGVLLFLLITRRAFRAVSIFRKG